MTFTKWLHRTPPPTGTSWWRKWLLRAEYRRSTWTPEKDGESEGSE